MKCPKCDGDFTVVSTVQTPKTVCRRRKCKNCENIVVTVERIQTDPDDIKKLNRVMAMIGKHKRLHAKKTMHNME